MYFLRHFSLDITLIKKYPEHLLDVFWFDLDTSVG